MNEKHHLALINSYRHQVKRLWFILFIVLFCLCGAIYKIVTISINEKTIVVPAGFSKPFTVQGDTYSNEYKEQMAVYLMQLLLNYQPNNVKYQFREFLRYVHPQENEALKSKLNLEAKNILSKSSSSVFYPNSVRVEDNIITIQGELLGLVGSKVANQSVKTYKLKFDTENGFYIRSVTEVVKTGSEYEEVGEEEINIIDDKD